MKHDQIFGSKIKFEIYKIFVLGTENVNIFISFTKFVHDLRH